MKDNNRVLFDSVAVNTFGKKGYMLPVKNYTGKRSETLTAAFNRSMYGPSLLTVQRGVNLGLDNASHQQRAAGKLVVKKVKSGNATYNVASIVYGV